MKAKCLFLFTAPTDTPASSCCGNWNGAVGSLLPLDETGPDSTQSLRDR